MGISRSGWTARRRFSPGPRAVRSLPTSSRRRLGTAPSVKKHLAQPEFEDITVEVGPTMSDALFDWIAAAWAAGDQPKDGALLAVDHQFDIKTERRFTAARIAATTVPTLDAASKVIAAAFSRAHARVDRARNRRRQAPARQFEATAVAGLPF